MKKYILVSLVLLATSNFAQELTVVLPHAKAVSYTVENLRAELPEVEVSVNDPVFKKTLIFQGFELARVLQLAGWNASMAGDEIAFITQDGYAPTTRLENLQRRAAYVVYKEKGQAGLGKVYKGKVLVDAGPLYVVWENQPAGDIEVPWPYQLATIEIIDFKSKYNLMMPAGAGADSPEQQGFELFKNHCMRCHSINLQGGDLGPELNVPRNVTEYWSEQNLRAFIKDASSFHARSKMPAFLYFTDEQIDQLVLYLTRMRAQKIADY
jgi:mono/diheme cytochrome c family protein